MAAAAFARHQNASECNRDVPLSSDFKPGLEGTVAAQTSLSHVDGQAGELVIRGFSVEELAARATYE